LLESLLPVSGGRDYIAKVSGFISPRVNAERHATVSTFSSTSALSATRRSQADLLEGYRSVLPHGVYPVAFLFLDVPLEEIDVNVHPAKTEVRFRRTEAVKDVIADAIRESLAKAGIETERRERSSELAAAATASPIEQRVATEQPVIDFIKSDETPAEFVARDAAPAVEPPARPRNGITVEDIAIADDFIIEALGREPTEPDSTRPIEPSHGAELPPHQLC
jgi:hypothetical protein